MATPPSTDTIELFKLLEDPSKWYGYYDIKRKIAEKVPPGRAIRKYKQRLKESRELRSTLAPEVARSDSEMIRLGAMACAQVALTSWKGKGIMIRGEGPNKEIRVKPGFQSWGLVTEPEAGTETSDAAEDPGFEAEGYTEVPPSDSGPSEAGAGRAQGAPEPAAEPPVEPVVEMGTVEVLSQEPPGGSVEPAQEMPTFAVGDVFPEEPAEPKPDESVAGQVPSRTVSIETVEACPDCGMGIVDAPVHEAWHEQLRRVTATSGSAFVDPETLRTLVEDVMRQALTRFQINMQGWLEEQFAEVERQIRLSGRAEKTRQSWS